MASPVQGRPSTASFGGFGVDAAQRAGVVPAQSRNSFASALAGSAGRSGVGVGAIESGGRAEATTKSGVVESKEVVEGEGETDLDLEKAAGEENGESGDGVPGEDEGEVGSGGADVQGAGAAVVGATTPSTPSTVHELNAELLARSRWAMNLMRGMRADGTARAAGGEAGRSASGGRGVGRGEDVGVSGADGRETGRGGQLGEGLNRERVGDARVGVETEGRSAGGERTTEARGDAESGRNGAAQRGEGTGSKVGAGAGVNTSAAEASVQARARMDDVRRLSTMRADAVRESVLGAKGVSAGEGGRPGAAAGSGEGVSVTVVSAKAGAGTSGGGGGGERSGLGQSEGRQQTAVGRAAGESAAMTNAQSAAVRAQALRGLVSAISRGETSLTIRMDPRQLGSMSIEVDFREGAVGAKFEVTTREARRLLEGSLTDLRRELETRGLEVGRLEVARVERSEDSDARALTEERGEEGRSAEEQPGRRFGADAGASEREAERGTRGDGEVRRAVGAAAVDGAWAEGDRRTDVGVTMGIDALV